MFVRIDKVDLLSGINMALRAVGTALTQPILSCLLFEIVDSGVRLTGNNLELCVQTAVIPANPGLDLVEGKVALDAKMLSGLINSFPAGEVTIAVDDKFLATIKSGKSEFKIAGQNPENFPNVDSFTPTGSLTIGSKVLKGMVSQTLFCAAQDTSKMILCGANIRVTENCIEMCALDGYRVAHSKMEIEYSSEGFSFVIPTKTLAEMAKLLPANKDIEVTMSFDEGSVWLNFEGAKVFSRLIEGNFPDYDKLFSGTHTLSIKINRLAFLGGIERANLIGDRKTYVKLEVVDGSMKISSNAQTGSMNEELDIELEGDSVTIGFNPHYIMDALKAIDNEKVEIDFTGPLTPCVIRPASESDSKYLVVPVKLQNVETSSSSITAKAA